MKKIFYLFLLVNLSVLAQTKTEMRGTWITNVDSDVMFTDSRIAEAMDYLESVGINVIFPVVWNKGYTLYPSQIMNDNFGVPIWQLVSGRDPLKKLVIEAHRNGIEVIPWFEFGFATSYSLNGGHILAKYPDWALKNSSGQLVVKNGFDWMSGIIPGVQNLITSLFLEVVDTYDVDGVQGDDRLPAMPVEGGYEEYTKNLYMSEHNGQAPPTNYGNSDWMRWRADKLTAFYKNLRDSVKLRGEHLIFSSTPSPYPWGYQNYLQDSKTWVTEGIVDNFMPQLYRQDITSYTYELQNALNQIPVEKRDIMFAGVLTKSGSYVITPELLLSSIAANRSKGVKGETLFFYEGLRLNNNRLGDTLKSSVYNEKALLPFRNGQIWRPKAVIVNEDDESVVKQGNWTVFQISGFKPNILMSNSTEYTSIEYTMDVPFDAWFEVYTYIVPNSVNSTNVPYTVYHGNDSTIVYVNQKDSKNAGWYSLGAYNLTKGSKKVIKMDNTGVEAGKYIIADASMIMINRKLSPDVVVTDVKETVENEKQIPNEFNLYQNYPNPFNPSTTINYSLNENTYVTLEVFNILGEKVAQIVNEYQNAGNYSVSFNVEELNKKLSSGTYFYSLTGNGFTLTKKMIYLK